MLSTKNINKARKYVGSLPHNPDTEDQQDLIYELLDCLDLISWEEGKKLREPFFKWITVNFINVDNSVGDLAREINKIEDFPSGSGEFIKPLICGRGSALFVMYMSLSI